MTLEIEDGARTALALASCPCDDRNLMFHVPDIPGDAFSEAVFEGRLSARDTVRLRGPEPGAFHFDDGDRRHSLILCWHTGFAPVASLAEHAMSLEIEKEIHLFRFSPTPGRQYLSNLCRSWADAYDTIFAELSPRRLTLLSSVEDCAGAFREIAARFPELAEFNAYVAGPPNFVEAARIVLTGHGLEAGRIRTHTDWLGVIG